MFILFQSKKHFHTIMMVNKLLSLLKAGNRLTRQSFLDKDEEDSDSPENEDDKSESGSNIDDPYERIGEIFICFEILTLNLFLNFRFTKKYLWGC